MNNVNAICNVHKADKCVRMLIMKTWDIFLTADTVYSDRILFEVVDEQSCNL